MAGRDQEEPYVPLPTADGGDPPDAAAPVSWRRYQRLASVAIVSILILVAIALIAAGRSINDNDEPSEPMENNPCSINLSALPSSRSRGVREGVSDKSSSAGLLGYPAECPYPWTNDVLSWQRTGFHFQPEQNWMNDPNGPLFYNGWYHLFYQYNPDSAVWGNITWGHAVSKDLIRWVQLPLAMVADKWYDINGVWTGSATILPDGRLVMLYTGSTNESVQVQNLAFPADESDPLLTDWVKSDANPVLLPPSGVQPQDFRDPTTAWFEPSDSTWRIAIGSKDAERAGVTYVYKTYDFVRYELLPGTLHRVEGTGMWECVDFYPIASGGGARDALVGQGLDTSVPAGPGVKHVLKASMDDDRHDYYAIGTYDVAANEWAPDDPEADVGLGLRYDWGKFYAAKTFYDQDKSRRVLWGWIGETDSERADVLKGWASLQGIPRSVLFDTKTGSNLLQWPVKEVETLRMSGKNFSGIRVDSGSMLKLDVASATQLDIEAVFEVEANALAGTIEADVGYNCSTSGGAGQRGALGPFGLLVLADQDRSEQTAVYFYISRGVDGRLRTHFCHDETRSSRARDIVKRIVGSTVPVLDGERLSLRVLVDHSIVESFAQGGRACITSRVYPTRAIYRAARVFLFNNATSAYVTAKSLEIWEMNSAVLHPDSAAH